MATDQIKEEVRTRVSIVDLVGQYVTLRRAGNEFIACCPFHQEKTPSFRVNASKGVYHCHGCKASGDVFAFLQNVEGLSFPEALRQLADQTGVELDDEVDFEGAAERRRQREQRERIYHACAVAEEFYFNCLHNPAAFDEGLPESVGSHIARSAVSARSLLLETTTRFRLGYAPYATDALAKHMVEKGVSPADAEIAGLLTPQRHGGGYHDRFRHRVMFPIVDGSGKTVGFSGRIIDVTDALKERVASNPEYVSRYPEWIVPQETGKYINSPETPIYHKSELVYGLQAARVAMRETGTAILVEGNYDVTSVSQGGVLNVVAPLGTSFTEAQAKLITRFAKRIVVLFDGDKAGRSATRNALQTCSKLQIPVFVATVPIQRDPDEWVRSLRDRESLTRRIDQSVDALDWQIDDAASRCTDNHRDRLVAMRDELADALVRVTDTSMLQQYLQRVQAAFGCTLQMIASAVKEREDLLRGRLGTGPKS